MTEEPKCVCKGIRKCAICAAEFVERQKAQEVSLDQFSVFVFCVKCSKSFRVVKQDASTIGEFLDGQTQHLDAKCSCQASGQALTLRGIRVIEDFIDEQEEQFLLERINGAKWVPSQNGERRPLTPEASLTKAVVI